MDQGLIAVARRREASRLQAIRFCGSQHGAAAIEFAIIASPFIALLLAVVQTTLIMFTQQVLETTAEKAGRGIRTGVVQKNGVSQSAFKTQVCATLPSFMACKDIMVDVQVANSFDSLNSGTPALSYDALGNVTNSWNYKPGNTGDIVIMRVMYQAPVVLGPLGFTLTNMKNGRRLLIATSVFKNESV